jgi:hypothetical protein
MLDELHVTALEALRDGVALCGESHLAKLRTKYQTLVRNGLTRSAEVWSLHPANR